MQFVCDLSSFRSTPYRRKYLFDYFKRMSTDQLGALWDDNVANCLLEQGYSIEEDPRSVYKVEKLYQALAKYAPKHAPRVNMHSELMHKGVALARACFSKPEDVPYLPVPAFTPEFIQSITSNYKASAGLTAWGQTKAQSYVRAYERGKQVMLGEKAPEPCLAFKRTQFNDKTRLVWGYPYSMTAIEGLFARPLIERFKGGLTPMAFGSTTGSLGSRLRVSSYHKTYAVSTDVSSFDSSIPADLIRAAFDILSTWFDLSQIEPTTGVQLRSIWDKIVIYFVTTPIVMPDGNIYRGKRHGVPSGSYFTQIVDSVVNTMIVGVLDARYHLGVDRQDIFVLGDDLLFWTNQHVTLDALASFASRFFGMQFNAAKSAVFRFDEPIHFLGRDWVRGRPELPENEILKRMAQPERYRRYSRDPAVRQKEVGLLLLSYACVYYNAYSIFQKAVHHQRFAWVPPAAYEKDAISLSGAFRRPVVEQDPDKLSGLNRYLLVYGGRSPRSGSYTPAALQFWK
nr:RNA-dependent RNA polymerase [Mute swan feces associated partitiviridae N]